MKRLKTFQKKKILVLVLAVAGGLAFLAGRLTWLMIFRSEFYGEKAVDLHERERSIKAARGEILDRNGVVLASNQSVCTVSVIHSQIQDPEAVIEMLAEELDLPEETVRKRVEKVSSIERISSNVSKETGDRILSYDLDGVKVDVDYKRYYPYDELASKVLGFTGGDNQGILGLEVKYEEWLAGTEGKILTMTDASGVEIEEAGERRQEPVNGDNLVISLDYNIQCYAQQAAETVMEEKQADAVSVILMDPRNGEILAMVNVPEYNLNDPFTLTEEFLIQEEDSDQEEEDTGDGTAGDSALMLDQDALSEEEEQELLNQMWRNRCVSDTYEPGSTFKIITTAAALEEGAVSLDDSFFCPGYKIVEDRKIRCHETTGHGAESFTEGIMNSCNPVFIELGLRLGAHNFYNYFGQFGLLSKTGVDLPGEASTIMHAEENIGLVELATISFGQSFQITPMQLITTVSSLINGGTRITPHLGIRVEDEDGNVVETFSYDQIEGIVDSETSEALQYLLEKVVSEGTGKNGAVEGYSIGGKTATSQTLPRSEKKYIASFLGFAPADDPQIIGLVVIYNPQGIYYGGTIAAPVMQEIFSDVLPYLGLEKEEITEESQETQEE